MKNKEFSEENTMLEKDKQKCKRRIKKLIWLAIFALVLGWLLYGNLSLQTTVYDVKVPQEYSGLEGYTIVQISDLHNARFGREQSRLIQAVTEQSPDMIVVTGDLVDSSLTNVEVAMDFINQAVEIAPVYYVTGNHEGWLEGIYADLKAQLLQAGVVVLENEAFTVEIEGEVLSIAGTNDPDMPGNNIVLAKQAIHSLMSELEGYTILLSHRPELFDTYVESDADLVFSGHYHGGQFRIPFIGGVVAPGAGLFPEYAEGTFTEGNTTMVVSRGLGNSVIPVRINNRPEVVVVRLTTE